MKRAVLALIRFYQRAVSPGLPAACRYQPTCSRYAYEAVERYGALRGGWMAARRLSRCVPWRRGGYDPVPGSTEPPALAPEQPSERSQTPSPARMHEEKDSMTNDVRSHGFEPAGRRKVLR